MNILKVENFNKYFHKINLILIFLSLSLIPWIEFINTNLTELDLDALNHKFKNMSLKQIQNICMDKKIEIYKKYIDKDDFLLVNNN